MPKFDKETHQSLRVEQRPASSRSDSVSVLKHLDTLFFHQLHRAVHILGLEKNMMDAFASLVEELLIGVVLAFQRLDQLQLQRSHLDEGLSYLDPLPAPAKEIF